MTRATFHPWLHLLAPALLARLAPAGHRGRAFAALVLANAVDLDHLLATPIYDPNRCSLGFHPLHSGWAIAVYALLVLAPRRPPAPPAARPRPHPLRLVGLGLLLHMLLDAIDCVWMHLG